MDNNLVNSLALAAPTIAPLSPQQVEVPADNGIQVDMNVLLDEWKLAKQSREKYTKDFPDLDSLVDGVPINRAKNNPFVGDTTLAALVRSIPRNSLQQLPVFSTQVNGTKNSIPALLCNFLLQKTAFNEDTFGKGLLSTLQLGAQQALTHGYAPFICASGAMYQSFGTTLKLVHFSDTEPEPGITDSNEAGYHYVEAHIPVSKLQRMLKRAQSNPDTKWNVDALSRLLEMPPVTKNYSVFQSVAEQAPGGDQSSPTYDIITRYETGTDSTIISFSPQVEDVPLRTLDSASKWGYPRVLYLVIDPAALSPYGTSRVRLASPNQNMMNIYYGNIAAMLLINSKPPLLKKGRFIKPVNLKQGALWETQDQNASATLVTLDNGALEQFPAMAQQFAGQIQAIMGSTVGTANSGGTGGFSKTAPGVAQQGQFEDQSTTQIVKILENFLRQYALIALDTLIAEQAIQGKVQNIIVDDDTKNAINDLVAGTIGDDNTIQINWAKFYAAIQDWCVDIDASTTPDQMKDKERADMQDMLVTLAQNAQNIPGAAQKIDELTNMLLQNQTPQVGNLPAYTPQAAPASAEPAQMPSSPVVSQQGQ